MSGLSALDAGDLAAPSPSFNAVYGQVPGELAPKLALALACERGGEGDIAEGLYRTCASTDANYVAPAAFGMARIRAARGDISGAVQALDLVPSTSRSYPEARRLRALAALRVGPGIARTGPGDGQYQRGPAGSARARRVDRRRSSSARIAEVDKSGAKTGVSSARTRPRKTPCETAWRPPIASWRESRPTTGRRYALVDKANAVRRWTLQ